MSETNDNEEPSAASRACGCYAAAERLIIEQYRITTPGKDSEGIAKDRYDVAVAYKQLVDAVRNAIAYSGGRQSEWGERAEECFRILERGMELDDCDFVVRLDNDTQQKEGGR